LNNLVLKRHLTLTIRSSGPGYTASVKVISVPRPTELVVIRIEQTMKKQDPNYEISFSRWLLDASAHLNDAYEMWPYDHGIKMAQEIIQEYLAAPESLFDPSEFFRLRKIEQHLQFIDSYPNVLSSIGSAIDAIRSLHSECDLKGKRQLLDNRNTALSLILPVKEATLKLIKRLGCDQREWHALGSRKFEEILADIWQELGWKTILTPPSGDGGIDIRAVRNNKGIWLCYLIQAKAYDPQRPVGIEAVRTLYGVVERERASHGILATTSRFTAGAIEESQALRYRVSLAGFEKVLEWTREYQRMIRL